MLELDLVSPSRYRPRRLESPGGGTNAFGGHLLALLVMAASAAIEGRPLTSLHAVFARGARVADELLLHTHLLAAGRNAASVRVSAVQDDATCVEALALSLTPQELEPAHASVAPQVGTPADATPVRSGFAAVEVRVVGGVDLGDEDLAVEPALDVWVRPAAAPETTAAAQAMLAYASEPHFLGTALLAHRGHSQAQAFDRYVPAVLSHSLSFHADPRVGDGWWLFSLRSPHLARGRVFGRGDVFAEDGTHLASVTQENLMRPIAPA